MKRHRRQGIGGRTSGPTDSGWRARVDLVALWNKVFHREPRDESPDVYEPGPHADDPKYQKKGGE